MADDSIFRPVKKLENKKLSADSASKAKPPGSEQRQSRRQRVMWGGVIVSRDGVYTWDCTVRDISQTGAKILLAPEQIIPEQCYFLQLKEGIAYEAAVEWLRPPEAGLMISNPYNLRDVSNPNYQHLRSLWQGRRMRTG